MSTIALYTILTDWGDYVETSLLTRNFTLRSLVLHSALEIAQGKYARRLVNNRVSR